MLGRAGHGQVLEPRLADVLRGEARPVLLEDEEAELGVDEVVVRADMVDLSEEELVARRDAVMQVRRADVRLRVHRPVALERVLHAVGRSGDADVVFRHPLARNAEGAAGDAAEPRAEHLVAKLFAVRSSGRRLGPLGLSAFISESLVGSAAASAFGTGIFSSFAASAARTFSIRFLAGSKPAPSSLRSDSQST